MLELLIDDRGSDEEDGKSVEEVDSGHGERERRWVRGEGPKVLIRF